MPSLTEALAELRERFESLEHGRECSIGLMPGASLTPLPCDCGLSDVREDALALVARVVEERDRQEMRLEAAKELLRLVWVATGTPEPSDASHVVSRVEVLRQENARLDAENRRLREAMRGEALAHVDTATLKVENATLRAETAGLVKALRAQATWTNEDHDCFCTENPDGTGMCRDEPWCVEANTALAPFPSESGT